MDYDELYPHYRINPEDRCTHQNRQGTQCPKKAFYGGRCRRHGGLRAYNKMQKRIYHLANAEYDKIIGNMTYHEALYLLREDIALTTQQIKQLEDDAHHGGIERLRLLAPLISDLREKKRRLVADSLKNEKELGSLQPVQFTYEVIQIYRELVAEELLNSGQSVEILQSIDEKMLYILKEKLGQNNPMEQMQ